jgi:hypothetical protein
MSPGNLGQVEGAFLPRDPSAGKPAAIATAVYLQGLHRSPSGGRAREYVLVTEIDESAKDRTVRAFALRLHRKLRIRFRRAQSAGLLMNDAGSFQLCVFGRGPNHSEIPEYFTWRNPYLTPIEGCDPVVCAESSPEAHDTARGATLGTVRIGYLPASLDHGPMLFTAVYLLKPFKDAEGQDTHVFLQKTVLGPAEPPAQQP